jgi:hypothetical protein
MFVIASSHANRNCETSVRIITSERNLSKWQISRIVGFVPAGADSALKTGFLKRILSVRACYIMAVSRFPIRTAYGRMHRSVGSNWRPPIS